MIERIKATRNTLADGAHLTAGQEYDVPKDVSEASAKALIRIGKAVEVLVERPPAPAPTEPEKPATKDKPKK